MEGKMKGGTQRAYVDPARHEWMGEPSGMKMWRLWPRDMNEPPFHFSNVPKLFVVAAPDEEAARNLAANHAGAHMAVWADAGLTACAELRPDEAGVVARELT